MPCDGKNVNCDRRRELLAQLKCLISSMERKKPCEWDQPSCEPTVYCPAELPPCSPCCKPVKACRSFELRASIMYKCECIKRNGLQDRCMMWDCMGRPECMTKLYPICGPGRFALLKLTDLGDAEVALRKFYCADQAREAALATYCRLTCDPPCKGPLSCYRDADVVCMPYDCLPCPTTCNASSGCCFNLCGPASCCDLPLYPICMSPYPDCYACVPRVPECSLPCNTSLLTCPSYPPVCPTVPCCP